MADCLNNEEQVSSSLESANQDNLNSNLDADNAISSNISSDAIMVSNADAGETISSTLADEDTLESPLDLPVAHTYGGAETDNIVVTVNNNTYRISASLKPIKFKSLSDFPEVGSERLIYIDSSENSLYTWDSESLSYQKLTAGGGEGYDDSELRGLIRNLETGKVDKVEGKDLSTHDFTEAYKSKLDGIESGAEANTVDSVNGQTGEVNLTFSDVNAPSTEQFNDFKTATETSIENIVNNTTKIAGTNGGFSAGTGSKMLGSEENSGGGAIGVNAQAYSGGAVGLNARASDGFAGGKNAKVGIAGSEDETAWTYVDAVQLGAGNNTREKTLQVYDDNIYNATNHALTVKNIVLDGENLKNILDNKVGDSELTFVSYNEQTLTDEQKAQARANIGVTDGESDVDAVLNNTRIIARDTGGFLAGSGASFSENGLTEDYTGGAIGKNASTTRGGAVGQSSSALYGGAVGYGANTQSGGAIGFNARAGSGFAGGEGAIAYRDAIQLGTGTNQNDKTLQVYDKNIYDANTDTLTVDNISLGGISIDDKYLSKEGNAVSATKATQDGDGNVITSKYVTLDTAQTISGDKTFTLAPKIKSAQMNLSGTTPTSTLYKYFDFLDTNNSRVGLVGALMDASGYAGMYFQARNNGSMGIKTTSSGTAYAWAPTPPTSSNANQIATTDWVRDVAEIFKSFTTGTSSSLSSYWFPLWKQTSLLANYVDINYKLSIGNRYDDADDHVGAGILSFGLRNNGSADNSNMTATLKVESGNLNPNRFKLIKKSDNMHELWVNTGGRYNNCTGKVLQFTNSRSTASNSADFGTFNTTVFSEVQTVPSGTETACVKANYPLRQMLEIGYTANASLSLTSWTTAKIPFSAQKTKIGSNLSFSAGEITIPANIGISYLKVTAIITGNCATSTSSAMGGKIDISVNGGSYTTKCEIQTPYNYGGGASNQFGMTPVCFIAIDNSVVNKIRASMFHGATTTANVYANSRLIVEAY